MQNTLVALTALAIAVVSMLTVADTADARHADTGIYSFKVKDIDGKDISLSKFKGKVLLVVNTASLCGNTPQYAKLEALYTKYKDQGLEILAFPANNFGSQEPGTNAEIKTFCTSKYSVTFPVFSKISVKGDDKAPLYHYLTEPATDPKFSGEIEWNFAKFLISRNGEIVGRFQAGHAPDSADVVSAIEAQLAQK